jgi:hypothetical protein
MTHDTTDPTQRQALTAHVIVNDSTALHERCSLPLCGPIETDDALIDLLATICRDTVWSPDAFGCDRRVTGAGTLCYVVSAFADERPAGVDVVLVSDAIEAVDGLRVLDLVVQQAVDV